MCVCVNVCIIHQTRLCLFHRFSSRLYRQCTGRQCASSQLTLKGPSGDTEWVTLLLQPERLPYSLFPFSLSSYTCYLYFIVCLYFSLLRCTLNLSFNFPPQGHFSPCSYMLRIFTQVDVGYSCVALSFLGYNTNQSCPKLFRFLLYPQ